MDYEEWEPTYKEIIDDFGYTLEEDRKSAEILAELRGTDSLEPLERVKGKVVEVKGPFFEKVHADETSFSIVAGSSASRLKEKSSLPDLLVTDLDGDVKLQMEKNLESVTTVIHAHGDNVGLIEDWAPKFQGPVISTCQCRPPQGVYNFGGFTDGDRAVVLADHLGAEKVVLDGWDLERVVYDDRGYELKRKKLRWAERIIEGLDVPVEGLQG